jgi:flagellar hook-length control protein FliK
VYDDMLSIHNVGVSGGSALSGGGMTGVGGPETGGADFFQFLLGLQANPQNSLLTDVFQLGQEGNKTQKPTEEDPLLDIFGKKEKSAEELSLFALSLNPNGLNAMQVKPEEKTELSGLEQTRDTKNEKSLHAALDIGQLTAQYVDENSQLSQLEKPNADATVEVAIQKYLASESNNEAAVDQVGIRKPVLTQMMEPQTQVGSDIDRMRLKEAFTKNEPGKKSAKSEDLSHAATAGLSMAGLDQLGMNAEVKSMSHSSPAAQAKLAAIPDFFEKVATLAHAGGGKMTVSLNPPHLGEVTIQVTTRGNKVEVEMSSDRGSTRNLMEQGLPDLIHSIEAQDLVVSKMEIHQTELTDRSLQNDANLASRQGGQFSGGSEGYSRQSENQARSNSFDSIRPSLTASTVSSVQGRMQGASGSGRLDLRI